MATLGNGEKSSGYGVVPNERRRDTRVRIAPTEILYMNFQSGNGAIVLDVSSAGLGFQAADRIDVGESLKFRFSNPAVERFEIVGQVIWLDEKRKRGGLRLNHLPVEVRREIQLLRRRHLPSTADVEPAESAVINPTSPNASSVQSRTNLEVPLSADSSSFLMQQEVRKPPVKAPDNPAAAKTPFASALASSPDASATKSGSWERPAASPTPYPSEWHFAALSAAEESRWSRHIVTVSLVVALVVAVVVAGFLYFGNKRRVGEWLIDLGESISGEPSKQSLQAPATAPVSAASPGPLDSPGSEVQNPQASGGHPLAAAEEQSRSTVDTASSSTGGSEPVQDSSTQGSAEQHTAAQKEAENVPESTAQHRAGLAQGDNGESDLERARSYLQGTGRADRAMAAELLWASVGKGNSDAEVELADLYLQGEGAVPKNCEQARILLRAAQKNHHPEASQRLAHLRDYGCR